MSNPKAQDQHSVAITGLSCRFPGDGDSLESFWESICAGQSAWSKVPSERFKVDSFWSPSKKLNTIATQGAHFLRQDVATFDAAFFSLSKVEVEAMDPQHRLMTEVAYEALEKAGLSLEQVAGTKTGVFMAHFTSDYKDSIYRDPDNAPSYTFPAASTTSLANRISWLFDLKGPSLVVDTACSSSLVALHLACQSLRARESDMAIVGGVNLLLSPEMFMYLSNQNFLARDGRCKSFDESADGYGRGEGFACVILKRVDDAITANDPIRAVIRGTGSNQDGHTTGFTLPSALAQMALIKDTYRSVGLDFHDTGYVEAHGTGTQAGDVQETEALAKTLATSHSTGSKLLVGSVKSNIGHLEAAAGLAGVVKAVLILENGLIPPSIHLKQGNPKIKFEQWNIKVPTRLTPWPTEGLRRVSVNSFGYGGTNAHAILDDACHYFNEKGVSGIHYTKSRREEAATNGPSRTNGYAATNGSHHRRMPRVFALSAQDREGLKRLRAPLADYLRAKAVELSDNSKVEDDFMRDLAYTLHERRSHLQWKSFAVATSLGELAQRLEDDEDLALISQSSRKPRIGFVFTGQGAQWPGMGTDLMPYRTFKDSVYRADKYLQQQCGCSWSVVAELQKGKSTSQLHLAAYSQTLCTVLQVALVDLLKTWSISPVAVVGHSSGEIAAAYCLGALTEEDAWRVAYHRGVLSSEIKDLAMELDGSMMVVGLSSDKAQKLISEHTEDDDVVVACVNSPSSVTISGDTMGIDKLLDILKAEGIFARKLHVDIAYHSPHMQTIAQDYYDALADITPRQVLGDCTMHSTVTGGLFDASQLGAVNWVRNLVSPVQFSAALYDLVRPLRNKKRVEENAVDILVEIGPHAALQGPSTQTLKAKYITNVPYYSVMSRNENSLQTALSLAGALFTQGLSLNLREVNVDIQDETTFKPLVDLPKYPWKHSQRFWHQTRTESEYRSREQPRLNVLGAPSPSLGEGERLWRASLRLSEEPWMADHKIQGEILYPAAGFLAMAVEAAWQTADRNQQVAAYKLRDIQFTAAAIITEETDLEVIVQLRPHLSATRATSSTWTEFVVTTAPDGKTLQKNCSGLLIIEYESAPDSDTTRERNLEVQTNKEKFLGTKQVCKNTLSDQDFYKSLSAVGLMYGPIFANVIVICNSEGQSACTVRIPDVLGRSPSGSERPHIIHPGTLDAAFHLAFAAVCGSGNKLSSAMVPRFIEEVIISANVPFLPGTELEGFSSAASHGFRELQADIALIAEEGEAPVIEVTGLICSEIVGAAPNPQETEAKLLCSKTVWGPAIDLLSLDEQRPILDGSTSLEKISQYLSLLHHSNPALSILEISFGQDDSTPSTLCLGLDGIEYFLRTGDVTIACRDEAKRSNLQESIAPDRGISTAVLDISRKLSTETTKPRHYDVVIANNVNAHVENLTVAAENMVRLMKSDGKLIAMDVDSNISVMEKLFSANDVGTLTFREPGDVQTHPHSLIICKKIDTAYLACEGKELCLIEAVESNSAARNTAKHLAQNLQDLGYEIGRDVWGSKASTMKGKDCIILTELDDSLLQDIDYQDFMFLKSLILEADSIFWVTGFAEPGSAIVTGLARSVRNEIPGLTFRTLHIEERPVTSSEDLGSIICKAFQSSSADNEFLMRGGVLNVSRIDNDSILNEEVKRLLPQAKKKCSNMTLAQARQPVKLSILTPGMLDSLYFEYDELAQTEIGSEEVEVQVKATALNFREVMTAMGQIADSFFGFDASGIVRRVGSAVTKFKFGDKVAMYRHGAHRTILRSRADYCEFIPDGLSFEEAATIPVVHGTSWYALVRLANVQKGQSILVHAAAGGVGQAAIQIAKHFGLEIFATVSSQTKRDLLRDNYDIPNDHIFNSRDLSFVKGVKRMTKGGGVDIILNSLSGEALRQTWHLIAPFGTFIEIGLKDILANTGLDMRPFLQDATFSFFNLNHIEKTKPDLMAAITKGVFDFQRRGITRPITPLSIYTISKVESAFRLMQTGKHLGKIALTWAEDHVVPVMERTDDILKFDPEGVYVLAGGLGGLGRELCTLLADHGARKLCILSRSRGQSVQAQELIQALSEQDVDIAIAKCDITDEAAVERAIRTCTTKLGRIRGIFQCAMVLRDVLFTNMTYSQWTESTRPKVQGSWNLHKHLPDVDFFITLSSFAAIFGNRGQSNYAAAGAYEDALAHHRRAHGQHAVTLDLGIMRDIGVLAETGITANLRDWEEAYGIHPPEFRALIRRAITGDMAGDIAPQVHTGLATGGSAMAAGIDTPFYLSYDARFSIMAALGKLQNSTTNPNAAPSYATLISRAKSLSQASDYVLDALVRRVAKMLQTSTTDIDTGRFLHSYGIDSLTAIEIVNWALKDLKAAITVFDVLAGVSMAATARKIAVRSAVLPKALLV